MFNLREYREPTHRLPDLLPWAALVAPGVILQKDAVFQKTFSFRGPDLASASSSELVSGIARLNNALKRLGSGWTLFVEAQRREASHYPSAKWPHPAAWIVDFERRQNARQAGTRFESSYFLTFSWQVPTVGHQRATAIFFHDPAAKDPNEENLRDIARFTKAVAEIADIMCGVFPDVDELDDDQTLTYLHSTISTNRHHVRRPEVPMYIDGILPDVAYTPGDIPMLGDVYIPTCTISGFPGTSVPGILDQLNHLALEYRWVTRFICLSKEAAHEELVRFRKGWWQKRKTLGTLMKEEMAKEEAAFEDGSAANKARDADIALQELGDDLVSFGYLTTTVTVWDQNLELARRKIQTVKQAIQSRGFTVKDETFNSREAWLGSLPGNVYPNVRRPIVNTLNLAHLMPVSAVWAGELENHHLRQQTGVGHAHLYCSTSGETPFRLNLAVGDVGHTLIVGPTGAGKSTLVCLLALQFLKYPNAQVIIFDKDRSARAATLAVEGAVYEPGNERAPTAFQPLAGIHERAERIWAANFVLDLLAAQNVAQTPDTKKLVGDALLTLAQAPVDQRTLTVLVRVLPPSIGGPLLRYTIHPSQGTYGQIFDASTDGVKPSFWQMFEMGPLLSLGEEAVVPALAYLFHRVEAQFDGRPTLMILDEAWLFLKHPTFMGRLEAWLKTLRKKNVYVVFATQDIADAATSPILPTILSACPTKIYLPNEEAATPAMARAYADFGLSETEIAILSHAQKKRDYYYRSVKGRRLFTLDLGQAALAYVATSSPDDQKFLDKMIASTPSDRRAEALLRYRNVDWAAELLEGLRTNPAKPLSS